VAWKGGTKLDRPFEVKREWPSPSRREKEEEDDASDSRDRGQKLKYRKETLSEVKEEKSKKALLTRGAQRVSKKNA